MSTARFTTLQDLSTSDTVLVSDIIETVGFGGQDLGLRADLADPTQGGEVVAWERKALPQVIENLAQLSYTQAVDVREYAHLVTDKPDVNDDTTWDWQPALQQAVIDHEVIEVSGELQVASSVYRPSNSKILRGAGPTGGKLVARGDIRIFEDITNFVEGWLFENIVFSSTVPGQGTAFYSPSSRYLATTTFRNVGFEASLKICVEANLVICKFEDCDFGTFGNKTGATHQHIVSVGEALSSPTALTTGLVRFDGCRFRNARGTAYSSRFANGYDITFAGCDIEMNTPSVSTFRFDGIYGVQFSHGTWAERNNGVALATFGMDTTGTLQGCEAILFDGCWLKAEADNVALAVSDTVNFTFSVNNCAGSAWSGKVLYRVDGVDNAPGYLRTALNNRMVGLTTNRDRMHAPLLTDPEAANYVARAVNPQITLQYTNGATQGTIIGAGASAAAGEMVLQAGSGVFEFRGTGGQSNAFVSNGEVSPGRDAVQSGGTAGRRYSQLFAATATISTSDERSKTDIRSVEDRVLEAWGKVNYCQYKFKDSVEVKGSGARWHFGLIAQEVKKAFEDVGVDPFEYGILCYDVWEAEETTYMEDGSVFREGIPAGDRYGIRYEEALALECAYLRTQIIR